jgi:GT2 family glycosyltransferase/SAM-dependent methyltransferase
MDVSSVSMPIISIIVPTRRRPERLRSLLDSVKGMTRRPERIEIILVTDSDDQSYDGFAEPDLTIRRMVVAPGLSMGELNRAGYAAASGEYLMLLNDDVVLRTPGWDEQVLAAFRSIDDGIVLVHVNDHLFEDKLCTFPFLSRTFCELAGGICPGGFRRYRIDDHIYNVFNLLSVLGKNRLLYLPDVVFEHHNFVRTASGKIEYQPDEAIHKIDTELFDELLPERKVLAVRLARFIDEQRRRQVDTIRSQVLAPITDSIALRKPEYVRFWQAARAPESARSRVTVGIVSADIQAPHARACIAAVKKYTPNFDLVILDNNRGPNFNHPREMNRILDACQTDYLVLMDDDVIVEAGWLDGMMRCFTPSAGVVTPLHKSGDGILSYAGVVMAPDYSGHHTHAFHVAPGAFAIQTLCSAVMLIDMTKCGHIRVDESYSKYFLDIDYGFRIWEAGFEVVCSPHTLVTHLGGATLAQSSDRAQQLFDEQRQHFLKSWVQSGRYQALEQSSLWRDAPSVAKLLDAPQRVRDAVLAASGSDPSSADRELRGLFEWLQYYPALLRWAKAEIAEAVRSGQIAAAEFAAGYAGPPIHIESNFRGLDITLWNGTYYAVPRQEGPFMPALAEKGDYRRYFKARDLALLKSLVEADVTVADMMASIPPPPRRKRTFRATLRSLMSPRKVKEYSAAKLQRARLRVIGAARARADRLRSAAAPVAPAHSSDTDDRDSRRWLASSPVTRVVAEYRGRAIYRYEFKYFAVPATSGSFSYEQYRAGIYGRCPIGHSIPEVKRLIDREAAVDAGANPSLVFGCAPPERLASLLAAGAPSATKVLWSLSRPNPVPGVATIGIGFLGVVDWAREVARGGEAETIKRLAEERYSKVVIPWSFPETWRDNALEVAAAKIADHVEIIHASGERRDYHGENLHRLVYNKAYLASMFEVVPEPRGGTVLEVGCSDGMVCDLFAQLGASKVVGIDVMETVGCIFPHPAIEYQTMEAGKLDFPDGSFDIACSIATLEHVPDPPAVIAEILRVLKVGGYAYVQAGPLYHSPFGHHMFAYFRDHPWIHLRKTKAEIIAYSREKRIATAVERDYGIPFEQYVSEMLSFDHVNGLFFDQYGLADFQRRRDIEVLKFNKSTEGEALLTPEIRHELAAVDAARLIEHGFELAFRRRR